ncbi:MAG: hypothetical protein RIR26_2740 [Pseudomonadota bacterium]|jgi:hypothetical protein
MSKKPDDLCTPQNELKSLQREFMENLTQAASPVRSPLLSAMPKARIRIYQHAYQLRLCEALLESFPVTHWILGDDQFEALSFEYYRAYPSTFFNISETGVNFPKFLAKLELEFPFLVDLATLEWARVVSLYSAYSSQRKITPLSQISPDVLPRCALSLTPSAQLVSLSWDVKPLLDAFHSREDGQPLEIDSPTFQETFLLVFSGTDHKIEVTPIAADAYRLLAAIQNGKTLEESLALSFEESSENDAQKITNWFRSWTKMGIIEGGVVESVTRKTKLRS